MYVNIKILNNQIPYPVMKRYKYSWLIKSFMLGNTHKKSLGYKICLNIWN